MAVSLHHVVIDAHDLPALARFWAQVLGWRILSEREREVVIGPDATAPVGICFLPVREVKTTKNRLHLDLSPDPGEQEADAHRLGPFQAGRPGRHVMAVVATGLTLAAAALRDDHQHVRCRAAAARAGSSSPWRWAA
jgi:catechol 2,3-dioxygenase-like lactoylglutathione lyase family enzyme